MDNFKFADVQQTKVFTITNALLKTPLRMAEKAETCRRITTYLYIIVPNYSAVVGTYIRTRL
jgi:hypothetical protein